MNARGHHDQVQPTEAVPHPERRWLRTRCLATTTALVVSGLALSASRAGAINPCDTANPPEGCPPMHPHPKPPPPSPALPWRVAEFDPESGDAAHNVRFRHDLIPEFSASFANVPVDAESAKTLGDIGTVAPGYFGKVSCKNVRLVSDGVNWRLDRTSLREDGPLTSSTAAAIVTRGPAGEKVLTVPPLRVVLGAYDLVQSVYHVPKICFAKLVTPEHRASTIQSWNATQDGGQWYFDFKVSVTAVW
jgi:hypothetical protein